MNWFAGFAVIALVLSGCVASAEEAVDQDLDEGGSLESELQLRAGVNGDACLLSDYNCKLRAVGGNRIAHVDGSVDRMNDVVRVGADLA